MGGMTDDSWKNLLKAGGIKEFLTKNQGNMLSMSLSEYLSSQLYQKALRVADVVRDSGLTKSYVHQIFNGEKKPSRDKLIAIAFGLHLNVGETQRMLKLGGCSELYARVARDAIILFAIQRGMNLMDTEAALHENGVPTLHDKDR